MLLEVARKKREDAERLGARIKELREARQWTQPIAAQRAGVSLRTWQGWEAGTSMPRYQNREKVAQLFGMTVDELQGVLPQPQPGQLDRIEQTLTELGDRFKEIVGVIEAILEDQASQGAGESQRQDRGTRSARGRRRRASGPSD